MLSRPHRPPRRLGIRALAASFLALGAVGVFAAPPEVVATGLQFAEGTIFVGDTLYLVDYGASDVLRLVGGRLERVWHGDGCGPNGLLQVPQGLMVACFDGGTITTITLSGQALSRLDHDASGARFESPNDLVADGKDGLWFTASGSGGDTGRIFHVDGAGRVREMASGLSFANGIGLSPDGRELYVTESTAARVDVMTVAADGSLGPRRLLASLRDLPGAASAAGDSGDASSKAAIAPDSLRVDRAGRLFVAMYRGGGVVVLDPAGRLVQRIDVPGAHHTTLALSPDGRAIYVTAVDDTPSGYRGRLLRLPLALPR